MKKSITALAALLLAACAGRGDHKTAEQHRPAVYTHPIIPATIVEPQDRIDYMREHFWDCIDFADTLALAKADTSMMLQSYAEYAVMCSWNNDPKPVASLMRRAAQNKFALQYFSMLAEEIFYDPNSPLRNDELYIPVLEAQIASPLLDKYEKMAPQYRLRMAQLNRVGQQANDFAYTTADGRSAPMYGVKADYTLLFFNNPDCNMCREITGALEESPTLGELQAAGRLKVLALYPDEDMEAWHAHAPQMPPQWINAYDGRHTIRDGQLYDLKAIPSLYLLDRDKKVLLKDAADVSYIEYYLSELEAARSAS